MPVVNSVTANLQEREGRLRYELDVAAASDPDFDVNEDSPTLSTRLLERVRRTTEPGERSSVERLLLAFKPSATRLHALLRSRTRMPLMYGLFTPAVASVVGNRASYYNRIEMACFLLITCNPFAIAPLLRSFVRSPEYALVAYALAANEHVRISRLHVRWLLAEKYLAEAYSRNFDTSYGVQRDGHCSVCVLLSFTRRAIDCVDDFYVRVLTTIAVRVGSNRARAYIMYALAMGEAYVPYARLFQAAAQRHTTTPLAERRYRSFVCAHCRREHTNPLTPHTLAVARELGLSATIGLVAVETSSAPVASLDEALVATGGDVVALAAYEGTIKGLSRDACAQLVHKILEKLDGCAPSLEARAPFYDAIAAFVTRYNAAEYVATTLANSNAYVECAIMRERAIDVDILRAALARKPELSSIIAATPAFWSPGAMPIVLDTCAVSAVAFFEHLLPTVSIPTAAKTLAAFARRRATRAETVEALHDIDASTIRAWVDRFLAQPEDDYMSQDEARALSLLPLTPTLVSNLVTTRRLHPAAKQHVAFAGLLEHVPASEVRISLDCATALLARSPKMLVPYLRRLAWPLITSESMREQLTNAVVANSSRGVVEVFSEKYVPVMSERSE